MGVLGFIPFLQRQYPEVFKQLPSRLRALSGKTIVMLVAITPSPVESLSEKFYNSDGTLVTQRMYWAPMPHEYRHVLGWFRLITELKDSNVNAICVFDGKERTAAKAVETARRQQARRLFAARSSLEIERSGRLKSLSALLGAVQALPLKERSQVSDILKNIMSRAQEQSISGVLNTNYGQIEEEWGIVEGVPVTSSYSLDHFDECEIFLDDVDLHCDNTDVDSDIVMPNDYFDANQSVPLGYAEERHPLSVYDLANGVASLYRDYQLSRKSLQMSLAPASARINSQFLVQDSPTEEIPESRLQNLLTQEEERLWKLMSSSIFDSGEDVAFRTLNGLAERSQSLSLSYEKRSKPPTPKTYSESKLILEALGIPCITCQGPYEAEALASSLVLHGHADYVASEDTDVLIYEAPMLRNVTNRNSPLVIISGTQVRETLQLSRESYIDFALLLGTDFTQRIKNIGPTRAFKLVQEYGDIEHILESGSKYIPSEFQRDAYLLQAHLARMVYRSPPPVPEAGLLEIRQSDKSAVSELLLRFGLSRAMTSGCWDPQVALIGNYFGDNPIEENIETWK